jgi:hypothetical protein
LEKLLADLTARSLIIGKSVPEVLFYSLHMMAHSRAGRDAHRIRTGAGPGNATKSSTASLEMAMWKTFFDNSNKAWYRPRSAVAAYATVARMLGGSTNAWEVLPRPGVYAYVFQRPGGTVAALWSATDPCQMRVVLPGAERTDLMGNSDQLPPCGATLSLDASPLFLSSAATPQALVAALREATFAVQGSHHE